MSTVNSNTQQTPAASSRNKAARGGSSRSTASLEDASDLKDLPKKYATSVKTLKELFSDWAEEDLLSAFQDANGDLEDTITNIAEGHVTQWGEVKSRKEKRQAQAQKQPKPKPHHRDEPKQHDKGAHVPRPASFRGGVRGGAARGGRGGYSNVGGGRTRPARATKAPTGASAESAAGWDTQPASDNKDAGSWDTGATADSSKPVNQSAASANDMPAARQDTASKASDRPAKPTNGAPAAAAKPAPVSWASIAKRGVKPASPEPTRPEKTASAKETEEAAGETDDSAKDELSVDAAAEEPAGEDGPVVVVEETVAVEVTEVGTPAEVPDQQAPAPGVEPEHEEVAEAQKEEEAQAAVPSPKRPAPSARRLNQDAPVVMPSGNAALERIGVQFGSLNMGSVEFGSSKGANASSAASEKPAEEQPAPQTEIWEAAQAGPVASSKVELPPSAVVAAAPAATTATETAAATPQGPLTTYLQQQQQQQQQQQASAQAHPNANPASQMPLPNDYGAAALYGAEAQRNMMGFYDSYGYGQFVAGKDGTNVASSATDSQNPAVSGAQAAGANGSANVAQAGLFPQQVPQAFGMSHGMPYYNPYYYNMVQPGGQYHNPAAFGNNPALAAAYGQPFMKQGMYPMYPGTTPQGMQAAGSQQPNVAQQAQQQQQPQAGIQQQQQPPSQAPAQPQGQAGAQQAAPQQTGAKGPGVGVPNSAAAYGNIAQKSANPYGHYGANLAAGFNMYEQDPAALNNSPQQQFALGGIPGILSGAKAGGKDAGVKAIHHPTATAPMIGGTTYYGTPQQQPLGGYPAQSSAAHPQGYGHQAQHLAQQAQAVQQPQQQQQHQAYYGQYMPSYGQNMYQQQHPAQQGHQQSWDKK
ncbi:RNAPII degradation factor [Coemansia sp. RSA 552]|nr:RNAPII degradation factor [Coemansia sp. RSA 552]